MFKIKLSNIFIALVLVGATSCSNFKESNFTNTTNIVTSPEHESKADYYLNQGQYKFKTGYYQEAIEDYTQAIIINPNYADAYLKRGVARDVLQDFHGAIEDFTEVIKIKPNNAEAYNKRGISRLSLKIPDLQGAIEDHTQFVRINPNNPEAYFSLGGTYSHIVGKASEALSNYTEAIKLKPDYAEAYFYRGAILKGNKGLADIEKAKQLAQEQGNQELYNKTVEMIELRKNIGESSN